jgi:hypothetical protein
MQEVKFSKTKDIRLAKVVFYLPAGFLVVMKRAKPLTEFDNEKCLNFCLKKTIIPVEIKKR